MKASSFKKYLVLQQEQADCGPASLAMITKYYGGEISLGKIRMTCGITSSGSNLLGIKEAAINFGLSAEGY